MERQKQVKTSALIKMETFLHAVYLKIGNGEVFSLDSLAKEYKLSGSAGTALTRSKVIVKERNNIYSWLHPTKPDRALAITIADDVNRTSGNWKHKSKSVSQSESGLFDQAPSGISERAYLAGCIASGMYGNLADSRDLPNDQIESISERITFATNSLINQLKTLI